MCGKKKTNENSTEKNIYHTASGYMATLTLHIPAHSLPTLPPKSKKKILRNAGYNT